MSIIASHPVETGFDKHQENRIRIKSMLNEIESESELKMNEIIEKKSDYPFVFISHKSEDKKYGNALRNFLIGLGVKNSQLIYTSHPLNGIPTGEVIYDYLRQHITSDNYVVFLLSDLYFESSACLNEMGAAWVVQADSANMFVPSFNFDNPKYDRCVAKTGRMGIILNGDETCRHRMLEFKNKIQLLFKLENDEFTIAALLDDFIREIS